MDVKRLAPNIPSVRTKLRHFVVDSVQTFATWLIQGQYPYGLG